MTRRVLDTVRRLGRRPNRGVQTAVAVVGMGLVVFALFNMGSSFPPLGEVGHPNALWLSGALLAEAASLVAYALIVRQVLAAWGVRGRTRVLLQATVGGIAIGATLPGGQAVSTAYWYRQLRREGAGPRLAAFALAAAAVAGAVSLAVLLVVGVALAGNHGPLASVRVPVLSVAAALLVVRLVLHGRLKLLAQKLLRRWSLARPLAGDADTTTLVAIAGLAYLNWLLDCLSLLAALAAVGASVPAQSVLLTYALAQLVNQLPLLPGGGGTVELSLALGFGAFGHTSGQVLAGILLYRVITCWGLVPIGWLAVAVESRRFARLDGWVARARSWAGA